LKADEIMQVLRLTAMGRANHPDQQRLCEALEKLLAEPVALPVVEMPPEPKRGPGRPKKAE
jgi:hypothetical protein